MSASVRTLFTIRQHIVSNQSANDKEKKSRQTQIYTKIKSKFTKKMQKKKIIIKNVLVCTFQLGSVLSQLVLLVSKSKYSRHMNFTLPPASIVTRMIPHDQRSAGWAR